GLRDLSMAKYARESFLEGEEGIVGLRLQIRENGSVVDAQVTTSSGSARLDKAAQDVVKDWLYQPATMNGAPVEASVAVNIIWALQTLSFQINPEQLQRLSNFYPTPSINAGEQGAVSVRFFVMPDGKVAAAILDKTSGYRRLDEATLRMVKDGWRFAPGTMAIKESVGGWFRTNIEWQL